MRRTRPDAASLIMLAIAGTFAVVWAAGCAPDRAASVACAAHRGDARAACLARRAATAWPVRPTASEIRVRVDRIGGKGTWAKAHRVATCETGHNPRHYLSADGTPHGSYIGALGMFAKTFAYGSARTGYRGRTYQEQVAIAVASFPITGGGWGGWGCGGA